MIGQFLSFLSTPYESSDIPAGRYTKTARNKPTYSEKLWGSASVEAQNDTMTGVQNASLRIKPSNILPKLVTSYRLRSYQVWECEAWHQKQFVGIGKFWDYNSPLTGAKLYPQRTHYDIKNCIVQVNQKRRIKSGKSGKEVMSWLGTEGNNSVEFFHLTTSITCIRMVNLAIYDYHIDP